MLFDFSLQSFLSAGGYDEGTDFSAAFYDSHNGSFVLAAGSGDAALPLGNVHIPCLAADESLVNFDFASQLGSRAILQRKPDAVHHEPGSLLGDSEIAPDFIGTDSVLSVHDHP